MNTDKTYHIFQDRKLMYVTDSYDDVIEFLKKNGKKFSPDKKLSDNTYNGYMVFKRERDINGNIYFLTLYNSDYHSII